MRALFSQYRTELTMSSRQGEQLLVSLGIPLLILVFFSTVDVLPTGTGCAKHIHFNISRIDIDFDRVVFHQRVHEHRGKGSLPFTLGVERAHTHEAVNTVFALEPAVGIRTDDFDASGLNARRIAFLFK